MEKDFIFKVDIFNAILQDSKLDSMNTEAEYLNLS